MNTLGQARSGSVRLGSACSVNEPLEAQLHVTDALSKLGLCTGPPGSDVRTMATETTRTSGRDVRHKAVWHCEDEAPQNVADCCRRITNTGLTLTVVARGELPTDVNDGCVVYSS